MTAENHMRVVVVVATYNEAENLTLLLDGIRQEMSGWDFRVVIVDDASPDGTGQLADRLALTDKRITVVHRSGKLGLGSALRTGVHRAMEFQPGVIATMDADLSHPPEALPRLLAAIEDGSDVAVGSRYVRGGSITHWSLTRRVLSRAANALTCWVTGSRVRDNTGNFRAFKATVFDRLDLGQVRSGGYTFFIETLWLIQRLGFRVTEVPIHFVDRRSGASKIPRAYVLQAFALLLRLAVQRVRGRDGINGARGE